MHPDYLQSTAEFENRLRAAGYQQLQPFFILKEGPVPDERTGKVIHLTKQRLDNVADTQNRRIHDTGDATPIIIGHTKRNKDEKDQPELTGFATRWEVVPFQKTGLYGLQTIPWSKPENIGNYEKYPRRSPEFWTNPDLIDPISLLGANTPRLDLGLHRLEKQAVGQVPLQFANEYTPRFPLYLELDTMPDPVTPDSPATPANKDAAVSDGDSKNADLSAKVDKLMAMMALLQPLLDELQGPQGGPPGAPGLDAPGGAPPVPGTVPPGGGPGLDAPGGAPPMPPAHMAKAPCVCGGKGCPKCSAAQMSASPYGGTNSHMPAQMQMQSRDQQELQALRVQVASLQLARMEDSLSVVLDNLATQIVFDKPREMSRLIKLSKTECDSEIEYMKTTYKAVEASLPGIGVPRDKQALQPSGGPMQFAMGDVAEQYAMGADPNLVKEAAPNSMHDKLVEIVRNRGKTSPMEAFEKVMGSLNGDGTKLRS